MTPNATTTPATMTVEEAGHLLGISRRSAYRAVAAGHLPVIRLGRRILVPTHKLHALLGIPTDAVADPTPATTEIPDEDPDVSHGHQHPHEIRP